MKDFPPPPPSFFVVVCDEELMKVISLPDLSLSAPKPAQHEGKLIFHGSKQRGERSFFLPENGRKFFSFFLPAHLSVGNIYGDQGGGKAKRNDLLCLGFRRKMVRKVSLKKGKLKFIFVMSFCF